MVTMIDRSYDLISLVAHHEKKSESLAADAAYIVPVMAHA
jgi:hypothetical protein